VDRYPKDRSRDTWTLSGPSVSWFAIGMSFSKPGLSTTLLVITCRTCGKKYESAVENAPCPDCNSPSRRLPSGRLYYITLISTLVASTVGIWLLLAWPRSFEMMSYPSTAFEENLSVSLENDVISGKPLGEGSPSSPTTAPSPQATPQPSASGDQASPPTGQLPTPTPEPVKQKYIVQPGDTLVGIADRFGVTTESIISANALANPDSLQLDMELIIR